MTRPNPIIVVLGNGNDDKPHAAQFEQAEEALARKAAGLMGHRIGKAVDDRALALARKLPQGKIFATGKALLPFVKGELFEQLSTVIDFTVPAGTPPGSSPAPETVDPALQKAAGQLWDGIKVGSVVLVFDDYDGRYPNWCAAVVVAVAKDNETLTARWRDYPGCDPFAVKRSAVGLLRPVNQ